VVIGAGQWSGMIAAVSLRLLYLIFRQALGLFLLLGRTSSTKDIELRGTRSPCCAAPTPDASGVGGPSRVRRARPVSAIMKFPRWEGLAIT